MWIGSSIDLFAHLKNRENPLLLLGPPGAEELLLKSYILIDGTVGTVASSALIGDASIPALPGCAKCTITCFLSTFAICWTGWTDAVFFSCQNNSCSLSRTQDKRVIGDKSKILFKPGDIHS